MMQKLSIGIPTFNREKQLEHQLMCLINQDLSNIEEIIIADNDSHYDIERLIKSFDCPKIRLVRNTLNIKMATNMVMPFLYCKTKWLWLLSDDDEVLPNSIETILNEINDCDPNTGMIKFAIDRPTSFQKDLVVNTLEEYIDFYYDDKTIRRGDLVFISTNVYNTFNLKEYLGSAFEFSYNYIGFLVPVFFALNQQKISVRFSSKPIVKYIPPREGWYSFGTVGKGISTISHLHLNISKKYMKRFLNITMSITYWMLIRGYFNDVKKNSINDLKIIYHNIYRYYIPWSGKIVTRLFLMVMRYKLTRKLTVTCYYLIKRIK